MTRFGFFEDLHWNRNEILRHQVASVTPRNFVVMEVQSNLIKDQRSSILSKFKTPLFKAVAEAPPHQRQPRRNPQESMGKQFKLLENM